MDIFYKFIYGIVISFFSLVFNEFVILFYVIYIEIYI